MTLLLYKLTQFCHNQFLWFNEQKVTGWNFKDKYLFARVLYTCSGSNWEAGTPYHPNINLLVLNNFSPTDHLLSLFCSCFLRTVVQFPFVCHVLCHRNTRDRLWTQVKMMEAQQTLFIDRKKHRSKNKQGSNKELVKLSQNPKQKLYLKQQSGEKHWSAGIKKHIKRVKKNTSVMKITSVRSLITSTI